MYWILVSDFCESERKRNERVSKLRERAGRICGRTNETEPLRDGTAKSRSATGLRSLEIIKTYRFCLFALARMTLVDRKSVV